MAVLKDLIVHGPSRFISAVGFTDLTANKIEADTVKAENGYFTKLKAKTATMDSVVVNELLDVHGELHTKSWSNSNIATVDGNFHIVPTITAATATGTITYSSGAYSMDVTGAFATNTLTVGNSTSVVAWTPGSSLIVSGEVQINNEWLPLGTLKCDLGGSSNLATDATSKKIPLSNIKDSNGQVSGVLEIIREALNLSGTSSTLNFRNVKIAFYSRKNTKMYPIGILLTAQGTGSSKTFIDMYNGNNESSSTYGGLAMPVVRIGNLSGNSDVANNQPLPAVGGQTPTGWGIYTSNGYFSGTIAAEKGKIANFTINGTKLYSNGHSAYNTSVTGIYIGDDYISFGSGGVTYFNTSGTGKIGPWTLSTTYIRNGAITGATNTSVAGVYLGTDGLNISNGTAATTAYITKTAVNIGNKLTWNGTTLSVNGAITATSLTVGADATITDSSGKITNSTIYGNLDNFTILWNYENFSTANNGEGYICKYDPATGTKSDANGTVLWNGVKRTITKQMINPNTILPYNTPIYVVCRLSSATATTGTNYMVWYNSGWKYAAMPTPSAVGGTWTWADSTDIILGKFVEPSSEAAFVECEVYNPPWSSKQVTSVTTTAASAQALANTANANAGNAAKTATNFLSFDSTNGLRVTQSTSDYTKPYVQITNNGVKVIYNSTFFSNLTSSGLFIHAGNASSPVATFGSSIIFYEPGTTTQAATINGTGINIKAGSITLGSTFSVTSAGALTAKSGTIGKYTITDSYLYTGSGSTQAGIGGDQAFWAGSSTSNSAPFRVSYGGALVSTNITATGGKIASFNFNDSTLYTNNHTAWNTDANGIYMSSSGIAGGKKGVWYLWNDGSAKIGAMTLTAAGVLSVPAANITGTLAASHIAVGDIKIGAAQVNSGTFESARIPNLAISKITSLQDNLDSAANTAKSYLYYDSTNGLRIAGSSPSSNANRVQINSSSVKVYANANNHTDITSSGMAIYQNGVNVANFGSSVIELGKNSTASVIKLCGNKGTISAENNSIGTGALTIKSDDVGLITNETNIYKAFVYATGQFDSDTNTATAGICAATDDDMTNCYVDAEITDDSGDTEATIQVEADWIALVRGSIYMMDGNAPVKASQSANATWYKNGYGNWRLGQPSSSSKRYKEDIQPIIDKRLDPHKLYDIPIVQFKFKEGYFEQDDPYEQNRINVIGFIAEDIYKYYPQAAIVIGDEVENWNERYIIPPMLKLIQEQHEQIQALTERIEELERR